MPSCLTGQYRDILAVSARIAEIGHVVDDARLLAAAAWMRGYGLVVVGAPGEARRSLEEAVPFFESTGDKWWLAQVTCQIGRTYLHEGEVERARASLGQTLDLFEEIHDQAELAWASCYLGDVAFVSGDWTEAHRYYERSASLARTTVPRFYSHALLHRAELLLLEGATEQAREDLQRGLAVAEQCGEVAAMRKAARLLAEQDLALSDAESALARLQPLLDGLGTEAPHAFPPPVLAEAYLAHGDVARAEDLVLQRVQRFRAQHRRCALALWLRVQGMVAGRQQRWKEADRLLAEAATLAHAMPYPYAEGRILCEDGLLRLQRGEPGSARERLEAALTIFGRLGARKDLERVEHLLSALG
jgi:tetratricopeptide (TPR) repeat protein